VEQFFYDNTKTGVKFWTRVYNTPKPTTGNALPNAPMIRVRGGDTVKIKVVNSLGVEVFDYGNDAYGPGGDKVNTFHKLNYTNLHTHGWHVSGNKPQDNIMMDVAPGDKYQYEYHLPKDHAGGTFWYHAHVHGSLAAQVTGGLHGFLIVEDDAGEIPEAYVDMPELAMFFNHFPVKDLVSRPADQRDVRY
jgi:FtsP/CotA-like multicopper oxidase with cupredoxin domain